VIHLGELLPAIQQERQLISGVDEIRRLDAAPVKSEERHNEIGRLQKGTVESDPKPSGERCEIFIVEIVAATSLRIVIRGCT
jgi:hypothetical protein